MNGPYSAEIGFVQPRVFNEKIIDPETGELVLNAKGKPKTTARHETNDEYSTRLRGLMAAACVKSHSRRHGKMAA